VRVGALQWWITTQTQGTHAKRLQPIWGPQKNLLPPPRRSPGAGGFRVQSFSGRSPTEGEKRQKGAGRGRTECGCYWLSKESKKWNESREDCSAKSSQMLMSQDQREMVKSIAGCGNFSWRVVKFDLSKRSALLTPTPPIAVLITKYIYIYIYSSRAPVSRVLHVRYFAFFCAQNFKI
uniref:Uncharacterized protein n=1 Tax=Gopherus evgoodei TaxID=1825980 RepID=A0A8C4W1P9_9SAUR